MKAMLRWALAPLVALIAVVTAQGQSAVQPVLQRGYDANVSGTNPTEVTLNASNIGPNSFGRLFDLPVDEAIRAQPLYVPNLTIPNLGSRNVLYVASMNDTVYAFDADAGGAPLWSVNLASLFNTTAPLWADFSIAPSSLPGHLGILSTPVIDLSTNIMYVVACTLENSTMAYRLHAIDIATGAEPFGPGVLITGSYSGIMLGTPYLLQHTSLVLADNQLIVAFSAMQTERPLNYVGWVLAYDKRTLQQSGVFATVTTGNLQGGIWQNGRPPAVDGSGNVYVFTGNTRQGGWNGVTDFSESALKLDPSHGLALVDWFTAGNWQYLDDNDLDLSSSGPLLIPGTTLLAGGGKTGDLYVLDAASLGHWTANDSQVVQKENITSGQEIHGGPVYWEGSAATSGPMIYDWGASDVLRAYAFDGRTIGTTPVAQGSYTAGGAGGFVTVSSNGAVPGTGVVWATTPGVGTANPPVVATLHAYDAENITKELWNSTLNPARDGLSTIGHSVPPLVANGRVYMATASNLVAVYGPLPSYTVSPTSLGFGYQATNVASAPQAVTVTNTGAAALQITSIGLSTAGSQPFSQTNTCGTSVAAGGSCTVSVVFDPSVVGPVTASLSINTGGGAATQTVTLGGSGTVPSYMASPTSLAFGNQLTNSSSAAQSVKVTNTGTVPVPIASIGVSSAGSQPFSQTNTCGTSIAPSATCAISVVFDPASAGSVTATLNVVAGGGAGTQTVALSGNGILPTYTVSPTAVAFGNQPTNTPSAPQTVTVTNTGGSALSITAIGLSTPGTQPFSQSNPCGETIAAMSTCKIAVVFNPATVGSATATLSINAGGGAGTVTVALSGVGVVPTAALTAAPTSITLGASVTLTWTSSNASSCLGGGGQSGDGWGGTKPVNGTASVTPTAAGTIAYTLTCSTGSNSSQAASAQVVVASPPASGGGGSSGGGGAIDLMSLLALLTLWATTSRMRFLSLNVSRSPAPEYGRRLPQRSSPDRHRWRRSSTTRSPRRPRPG